MERQALAKRLHRPELTARGNVGTAVGLAHVTDGLLAIQAIIGGAAYREVWPLIGLEILIGLVYYAVGYVAFRRHLEVARRLGTIELF